MTVAVVLTTSTYLLNRILYIFDQINYYRNQKLGQIARGGSTRCKHHLICCSVLHKTPIITRRILIILYVVTDFAHRASA